ncbi:MAG: YbaB/EbfC family nucleoid-associated protein [Candidatus Tenebribacter mawsonii]|nr:YbaB/EbfC family nucleoid-associated protein [Candidatus Tenebribacter mawsonii]
MFPGGKKGMQDLMKQAKKMQDEMMKTQEELANKIVEGTSGGGMIKVQMNGKNQLISLNIDKEVVDPDDIEMLEDLIIAAVNEAHDKIAKSSEEEMGKLTGGMKIPGMF